MVEITVQDGAVLLPVKVVPGASRTRLMGEHDDRLKIAVAAAPEKGRANDALIEFLAKMLDVRKKDISVVSGPTSPQKTIRIEGATADEVRAALKLDRS